MLDFEVYMSANDNKSRLIMTRMYPPALRLTLAMKAYLLVSRSAMLKFLLFGKSQDVTLVFSKTLKH